MSKHAVKFFKAPIASGMLLLDEKIYFVSLLVEKYRN